MSDNDQKLADTIQKTLDAFNKAVREAKKAGLRVDVDIREFQFLNCPDTDRFVVARAYRPIIPTRQEAIIWGIHRD